MNTPTNRDMDCLTENGPAIAPPVLKSCPFCEEGKRLNIGPGSAQHTTFVMCMRCGGSGPNSWGHEDNAPYAVAAWNKRPKPKDHGVIEAMLAFPSVNEFVRDKEKEIMRLVRRLREALDYVTDATERWPVGSLENEVARAIEGRCLAEVEGYPADGATPNTERSGTPTPPAALVQS